MGFRTIVIINNDQLDQIQDPVLKQAVLRWWSPRDTISRWAGPYQVVEQCHADQVSLLLVDSLNAELIGTSYWGHPDIKLDALKDAADKAGYRLVKKSTKKK
jgi:hypothetical protein